MVITRPLAGLAIVTGLLLGGCSSEEETAPETPEMNVAVETELPMTPEIVPVEEEIVIPAWPELDQMVSIVDQAIAQFDAGDIDAMNETMAEFAPRIAHLTTSAPENTVPNPARLRAIQESIATLARPLEKGDDAPSEAIEVLREIAPLLDQMYSAADVLPPDERI